MARQPADGGSELAPFLKAVELRLRAGKGLRWQVPGGGLVQVDRPLPFLAVFRRADKDDEVDEQVWRSASSLLLLPAATPPRPIVAAIARVLSELFGAAIVLEVWAGPDPTPGAPTRLRIITSRTQRPVRSLHRLQNLLAAMRSMSGTSEVSVVRGKCAPPGLEPLLAAPTAARIRCTLVGIEVPPVYRDPDTRKAYPGVLREFRREVIQALRRWTYDWLVRNTTLRPASYNAIGPSKIAPAVWQVDRQLAEVADCFDFLLQATPVNTAEAWAGFRRSGFETAPALRYRPLRVDATLLKRRLYAAPIERIEEPALYQLFREKQDELDRQITMLLDMNTPRFVHGSIQLFGSIEPALLAVCREVLRRIPARTRERPAGKPLDAAAFARRAAREIEYLRSQWRKVDATVQVRQDIYSGLMVSNGSLLVGRETSVPASRVDALIQHEIGTHVLSYYNGKAQRFRQLYLGLAGYDTLQEGIGVLAEAFAGGLSGSRRRLLVARVVAVHHMLDGASFVETFRELHDTWGFAAKTAFTIVTRIYRGGGLTKDAVYVRGVGELLSYLAAGGELEALLVGKIAAAHVPLVQELRDRGVLVAPPLRPRYLDAPETAEQLARIRAGLTLFQLLEAKGVAAPGG